MTSHFGKEYGGSAPENYESYFVPIIGAPLASELVEIAALASGERVLDVACGTGIVTRYAAKRVGKTGKVAGLDVNPGMLAVARTVAPAEPSIEWHESSAQSIPLPDESFDVVLCQMSMQFFPDPVAALTEMRRVLVQGGRLALNVPGKIPPLFAAIDKPLEQHIGAEPARFLRQVFALADPNRMRDLIGEAGFREIAVRAEGKTLPLPPPEEFLWQYISSTPLAAPVSQADEGTRAAFQRDVFRNWGALTKPGAWKLEQPVVVATARK